MFHMEDSRYFIFVSKKVWVESGEVACLANRLHSCVLMFSVPTLGLLYSPPQSGPTSSLLGSESLKENSICEFEFRTGEGVFKIIL